ncbi:MAG: protein tyrosine phosphatase [Bacteroidota bacterium]|nr:protein tyrosine phosphatase [Bacteroidota bacterium]
MAIKKVLVLCTGNSCRSQIAEGYIKYFAGNTVLVYSAGIETHGVNPRAIVTMQEDGIDISNQTCNHLNEYRNIDFDFVITVCDNAKEQCPYFSTNVKLFHINFQDPAKAIGSEKQISDQFREVRKAIKSYSLQFVKEYIAEIIPNNL